MNLKYKQATKEDIEKIFNLNKQLIDQYENIQHLNYDEVLIWVHQKINKYIHEYISVFYEKQHVGYYRFFKNEDKMELDDLYIFEEYQNKGIGSAILQKCISESDLPIYLYVFVKNIGAIKLYKRHHFKIIQTIHDTRYIMQFERE